jgi:hypothetical protein
VKKAIRMKKKIGLQKTTAILSYILILSTLLSISVSALPSGNEKEQLYVATFLVSPPDNTKEISTMIVFNFNDTIGMPINISPATFDNVQSLQCKAILYVDKWFMSFSTSYATIDTTLANQYTDEVCQEFLKVIDLNLGIINRNQQTNNETGTIETALVLEKPPYDIPTTEKLLKYKPSEGFGSLITRDFLSMYMPANEKTAILDIIWDVKKDSGRLRWELTLEATSNKILTGTETDIETEINLNQLLNNSKPIPIGQNSKIVIEVEKKHEFRTGTYSMDITDISPIGHKDDTNGTILLTYAPPMDTMQNIVVKMKLSKEANDFNWIPVGIAIVVIVTSATIVFRKRIHRSKSMKPRYQENKGKQR